MRTVDPRNSKRSAAAKAETLRRKHARAAKFQVPADRMGV